MWSYIAHFTSHMTHHISLTKSELNLVHHDLYGICECLMIFPFISDLNVRFRNARTSQKYLDNTTIMLDGVKGHEKIIRPTDD